MLLPSNHSMILSRLAASVTYRLRGQLYFQFRLNAQYMYTNIKHMYETVDR